MNLITAIWISLMAGVAGYIVIDGVMDLRESLRSGLRWEDCEDESRID